MLAGLSLFSGPQDPSQIIAYLNTLVPQINSGIGGLYAAKTGATGTGADTTEDTLKTITLPANFLSSVGQQVVLEAAGTTGANGDDKTIKVKFGTLVLSSGAVAANGLPWRAQLVVVFLTAATQYYFGRFTFNGVADVIAQGSGAIDTTAAVTCLVTGQNEVATANDAVCSYFAASAAR